jgi:hypothetical protein
VRSVVTWQLNLGSKYFARRARRAADRRRGGLSTDHRRRDQQRIITAHLAAETALEALTARDFSARFLARYDERWGRWLWPSLRASGFLQRLLMLSPLVVDIGLKRLARWQWGIRAVP